MFRILIKVGDIGDIDKRSHSWAEKYQNLGRVAISKLQNNCFQGFDTTLISNVDIT